MNEWIIVAVIVGLLIVGSMVAGNIVTADQQESERTGCSTCGNSCNADINCGLANCEAVDGGSCGCGGQVSKYIPSYRRI